MGSFCANPYCKHHGNEVNDNVTMLNKNGVGLYVGHDSKMWADLAKRPTTVLRHKVGFFSGGLEINDFLCPICFEVFKLIDHNELAVEWWANRITDLQKHLESFCFNPACAHHKHIVPAETEFSKYAIGEWSTKSPYDKTNKHLEITTMTLTRVALKYAFIEEDYPIPKIVHLRVCSCCATVVGMVGQ